MAVPEAWAQAVTERIFKVTLNVSIVARRAGFIRPVTIFQRKDTDACVAGVLFRAQFTDSMCLWSQRDKAESTGWDLIYLKDVAQELAQENNGKGEIPHTLSCTFPEAFSDQYFPSQHQQRRQRWQISS